MKKENTLTWIFIGIMIGSALNYLYRKLSEPIEEKVKQGKAEVDEEMDDMQQRVKDIFNSARAETMKQYKTLRKQFSQKVNDISKTGEEVSEKKYKHVLNEFMDELEQDKSFTKAQLKKLKDYFKQDYQVVKQQLTA